ncbi:MAG: HepT-like ribonuclease domain-containing protein [Thermoplasmatota archaeon]
MRHILDAGKTIQEYVEGRKASFATDRMLQDAVIRQFQVMGEAAKRVGPAVKAAHPRSRGSGLQGFATC